MTKEGVIAQTRAITPCYNYNPDNLQPTTYKLQTTNYNRQPTYNLQSRGGPELLPLATTYNLQPRVIAILAYFLLQPLVVVW